MTDRGCFIRVGTAAEPMPQAMIDRLFATRTRNSIGKIRSNRQDLTFEQLRIYYEEKRKPLNKQFKKSLELLTDDNTYHYAGYLLADENDISIKVAKYRGTNSVDLIENNEYGYCSLVKATKSVLMQIMKILHDCMERDTMVYTVKERYELGNNINSKVLAFAFGLSAEIERNLISQRTKEALARRKAEGQILGRPKGSKSKFLKLTGKEDEIKKLVDKKISYSAIGRILGVHRITVSSFIKSMAH